MRRRTFLTTLSAAAGVLCTAPAIAAARHYSLDTTQSTVGFETDFGPDKITGSMPVIRADLAIDFRNLAASSVSVALDATAARASFPFAAQALKGPRVLDAATYPSVTFESRAVRREGDEAGIDGLLTIRGVTRPATLHAAIYRQAGTDPGDLSRLTIHLTGALRRSDFGATGWSDLVGDEVRIRIVARIAQVA